MVMARILKQLEQNLPLTSLHTTSTSAHFLTKIYGLLPTSFNCVKINLIIFIGFIVDKCLSKMLKAPKSCYCIRKETENQNISE